MDSLIKHLKVLGAAAMILFMMAVNTLRADSGSSGFHDGERYDPLSPAQTEELGRTAKRAALSAAGDFLKKSPLLKKINRLKQDIKERYSFKFEKQFPPAYPEKKEKIGSSGIKKDSSQALSFSGGFDTNMSPGFEFNSRLRPLGVAARFDILDHELDCEIKSPMIDRFTGGDARLGFTSDGEDTKAVFKMVFEF